jgi:Cytochrome C oxidase, cbb3-type, subunit III
MRVRIYLAGTVFLIAVLLGLTTNATWSSNNGRYKTDELTEYYKHECSKCHGDQAELKFDQTLSEADMVKAILKGKFVDEPPDMPAFEEKGVTPEKAKDLAMFMKQLRKATKPKAKQ